MNNKLIKNIIFGFGGQLVVLALGIIMPRIMLMSYGSDANGLISTITQIFVYMALLEAGIGQAARNALYKPISEKNCKDISYVVSVAQRYFRKITFYYGVGVIILAIITPFVLKSDMNKLTISLIVLLQGMSGVISFYFIQTQTIVLGADGRGYVNNGINAINQVVSYGVRIFLAWLGVSIVILQLVYFIIVVAKVFVYKIYFRKQYSWIDYKKAPKEAVLADRNSYIISEVAWTLFSSTDMIVLSTFISTQVSSVYAIYNLVFSNLNVLLNTIYNSVNYILGQTFYKDREQYIKLHDTFTTIFMGSMTILMSVSYIMVIYFVKLYTKGINDVEYIYNSLPIMFCLVQLISWSRFITGNLTAIAGFAKNTSRISLIEACINIILSVVLVNKFGIVGVLLATVVALPLKVIYCTYLADKIILKRSFKKTISILGVNYIMFFITVIVNNYIELPIHNYLDFFKYGVIITFIISVIGVIINVLVNPECIKIAKSILKV